MVISGAAAFEKKLAEFDLKPIHRHKKQLFKGIGGHLSQMSPRDSQLALGVCTEPSIQPRPASKILAPQAIKADVRKMIEDGTLLFLVVDGCMIAWLDTMTRFLAFPTRSPPSTSLHCLPLRAFSGIASVMATTSTNHLKARMNLGQELLMPLLGHPSSSYNRL
jgi:hypothetical protein